MDVRRPAQSLQDIENVKAAGFSLIREVIDAAAALVVRMPSVKVMPIGQQFKIHRGAKLMSRFLNGVFYENKAKEISPAIFNDAATSRCGLLKWYFDEKSKKIKCERLNSLWLLWDDAEGPEPKSLYYISPASKRFLSTKFPEMESQVRDLPHWSPTTVPAVEFSRWHEADRVKVTEAWTLPQGDKPGKHIIRGGDKLTLLDEEYNFPRFPIVPYRWAHGFRTWGGRPLGEILMPYQLWTSRIMRTIHESAKASIPKIMAHNESGIQQWTDKTLEVVTYRGPVMPQIVSAATVSGDLWKLREIIKAEAYEEGGVNPAIAQGTTSDNLKSAPAQRERMDIASTRLIHPTERFEAFWRDCADVIIMLAADAGSKIKASSPMGSYLREIPWEDIELKENEYSIEVMSTAALPLTVGGRLDFVNDLMNMKDDDGRALIKSKDGLRLLQMPDTDSVLDRETASQDLADKQVEAALWEGDYFPPEPIQDLNVLIETASKELMRALQNGTFPEGNLELCRRLINEAKMMVAQMQAPPPMPPQAPPPTVLGPQQAIYGGQSAPPEPPGIPGLPPNGQSGPPPGPPPGGAPPPPVGQLPQ
jgi:hypothetical protein